MKGAGTDEKTLIRIICNRSREQLTAIAGAFALQQKGKDLKHEIKKETSGNFRKILLKRFNPQTTQKAKALKKAMAGVGTNEDRLIDCIAFASNAEIPVLKKQFQMAAGKDLIAQVGSETSGHFKQALIDLLDGNRNEGAIDPAQLASDVQRLYKAGEGRLGTDEKEFIKVLCNHAPWYNVALDVEYKKQRGHSLHKAIEKEFSGDIKKLLTALTQAPYDYWADRFYYALKGAGTDDRTVVFITTYLERNELQHVANIVKQRHSKDLISMIKGDLSGDYEKAVLALFGH
jgi:annexin A7/11